MARIDNFSEDELRELVQQSTSKSDLANKLGYGKGGSNWGTIHKRLDSYGINWVHLLKAKHRGNNGGGALARPIEEYLVQNSTMNRNHLKKRLIKEGLLANECSVCSLSGEWNGSKIVLHLDHINGVNDDNRLHNLRLLCPNCHSQTATYAGSNTKLNIDKYLEETTYTKLLRDFKDDTLSLKEVYQRNEVTETILKRVLQEKGLSTRRADHGIQYKRPKMRNKNTLKRCVDCKVNVSRKATRCKKCAGKHKGDTVWWVKERPTAGELYQLLLTQTFIEVGAMYGVSDNAVRKWCKGYGIPYKATYYRGKNEVEANEVHMDSQDEEAYSMVGV